MKFFEPGFIWRDHADRPRRARWGIALLRLAAAVVRDVREGALGLRAAALSYTTLLSLAPLLALSFSVLKAFGAGGELKSFLHSLLAPLGDQSEAVTDRIAEFVSHMQVGVLGALGMGFLIYSVIALMHDIELALNDIWRIRTKRPFALRLRDYLSVLLIGPVLMSMSVAITASLRRTDIIAVPWAVQLLGDAVALLLFAAAFAALYMFMPFTRVRAAPACAAGLITGVMWKLLGWLFGVFVAGSASYAAIYSAFAALALFIIWVDMGWRVVLIGACICYYLQNPSNQRLPRGAKYLSLRVREKLAVAICAEVGGAFYSGASAPDMQGLSHALGLPAGAIAEVMEVLQSTGYIASTGPRGARFIPGRPFDATRVDDMLESLRAAREEGGLSYADFRAPAYPEGATLKQLSEVS
jgi:membrane protein